ASCRMVINNGNCPTGTLIGIIVMIRMRIAKKLTPLYSAVVLVFHKFETVWRFSVVHSIAYKIQLI
ncbi:hypothetical protein KIN20_017423, partial [Parelaphostrongylus tenuis]